jgi:hypothetical protein
MNPVLKEIIDKNPALREMMLEIARRNPDKNGMIFSDKLRKHLSKWGKMDIREAFKDPEFLKALLDYTEDEK